MMAQLMVYLLTGVIAAIVSAVVLGWGLESLGLAPFGLTSDTLVVNFGAGNCAGWLLYSLVYRRIKLLGLTWTDIMDNVDISKSKYAGLGASLIFFGAGTGWILGAFFSKDMLIVGACFVVIIIGALLV